MNDVSPGGAKRVYDQFRENSSSGQHARSQEKGRTDISRQPSPSKSVRQNSQTYVRDGSSIAAAPSGSRMTTGLTTEVSYPSDEDHSIHPGSRALTQIIHLTRELDEIKSLLPFLIATSTQRKAVSKLVERFLPKQSALNVPPSSTLATSVSSTSIDSQSGLVTNLAPDHQARNSELASNNATFSPLVPSPRLHAGSIDSSVIGSDMQEQAKHDFAPGKRAYIEVFGRLDLSGTIDAHRRSTAMQGQQCVSLQIQQHSISSLWLADHEIDNPEERRVNSAFNRMRDRSRAQIMWGVPPEAVFGLPYPALLFAPRGRSASNMDDALTLSDWIARLLDQYPYTSRDFPTRVGSWVLISVLFQWQVNPTFETWQKVPEWLRPLPCQTICPHLPALDFLVWPQVRERILTSNQTSLPLISSRMLLEWPFPHGDMVTQDDTTGALRISPEFESWCFELPHWHIDSSVEVDLPELTGLMSLMRSEQIVAQID